MEFPVLSLDDQARLDQRTEDIKQTHLNYVEAHPELRQLLSDFMANALLHKPDNVYDFIRQYFAEFSGVRWVSPDEAAVRIQSIARGNRDRSRTTTIRRETNRRPLVVVGPSGVGKSVLIKRLTEKYGDAFGFSVSHTTRGPREGEVDGKHYHFSTRETMEPMIAQGQFLEHADVHGNLYGTSAAAVEEVQKQGRVCILDIDVQGARSVRKSGIKAHFVFVKPPSLSELETRLRGRGTESEEAIQKRLGNAAAEIEASTEAGLFDQVIVNDDLDAAFEQIEAAGLLCAGLKQGQKLEAPSASAPEDVPAAPAAQEEELPDLSTFDEGKIVKIQSVARAKRDRARVAELRDQKGGAEDSTEPNDNVAEEQNQGAEEQAADNEDTTEADA